MSEWLPISASVSSDALLGWRLPSTSEEVPPPVELARRLRDSHVDWDFVQRLVHYDASGYTRQTLARTPACELILLCWLPGQGSRVHDHGGSYGASLVLRGELQEVRYGWSGSRLLQLATSHAQRGSVLLERSETIHRIRNDSPRGAVTLHLYAPPLRTMRRYEVDDKDDFFEAPTRSY